MNLTNLSDNDSDICDNHLFTDNEALRDFLNSKQIGGDWESCQTPLYTAAFSAQPKTGPAPLTVNFTNQSTGSFTSWEWNFGDGSASTEQNPSHTYSKSGTFTVSLTVSGPGGSDTDIKPGYIQVLEMGTFYFIPNNTGGGTVIYLE